jgi:4-amino-4-deoxychorismate lyase
MMLINGVEQQQVSALDRGLMFGDGVFRTLACQAGAPCLWRWQIARLCADARQLGLAMPDEALLLAEVAQVAQAWPRAVVKIILTRGQGPRGYAISAESHPTRIVSAAPWAGYPPQWGCDGVNLTLCQLRLARQPRLAGVKHLNRLENVLARSEWSDPQIQEGLLLDSQGEVIEGTMSNLFVLRNGRLETPILDQCGVAGALRSWIIDQTEVSMVRLTLEQLLAADEVFVCNSLAGIWPVATLAGRRWNVFTQAQRLATRLAAEPCAQQ